MAEEAKLCWRYSVIFCNTFLVFGLYYCMNLPAGLQNELMDNFNSTVTNNTIIQTNCKVCLGLGEVRYNVLFSTMRWASAVWNMPSGYMVDRLGNSRSAILLTMVALLGSSLFTLGALLHVPATTSTYILMVAGRMTLALGDGPLRLLQASVVAHYFPEDTFLPMAFALIGILGSALGYVVSSSVAATVGFSVALWLGVAACGFSVLCAVGLGFLLHKHDDLYPHDHPKHEIPTIADICSLPRVFWLYIFALGLNYGAWTCKQTNLPDYLEIRYGYTMTASGIIVSVPCFAVMSGPVVCLILKKIDCVGISLTCALLWMVFVLVMLGFCPTIHPLVIAMADGIGTTVIVVITWQILIIISKPFTVGSLGGIMYFVRHLTPAVLLIISGYILKKPEETDVTEVLHSYQHFYLVIISVTFTAFIIVVVMNVQDIRENCVLNSRIGKWKEKKDTELTELVSGTHLSNKYS